jgi:hypothetical protein
VTITGFLNPNPQTTLDDYYYFYDWVINPGCVSNRVPVEGVVLPPPAVPTISQAGNQLTSSSPSNNQWYLNGNPIPGATNQVYVATGPGSYTVVVTDPGNGCTSESQAVLITSVPEGGLAAAGISVYPNPAKDFILVESMGGDAVEACLYDALGKRVTEWQRFDKTQPGRLELRGLESGWYLLSIRKAGRAYYTGVVKL